MVLNSSKRRTKKFIWNPFKPTKRDIARTKELAAKNLILADILGFLFPVFILIYLNRIENYLKIVAYMIIISISIGIISLVHLVMNQEQSYEEVSTMYNVYKTMMGLTTELFRIAAIVENSLAVILARKRQSKA